MSFIESQDINIYKSITCCRICKNKNLVNVINLGEHYLSGRFPLEIETNLVPKAPLILVKCDDSSDQDACGLLQLRHSVNPCELYNHGYGYRSGINSTMTTHLQSIITDIENLVKLNSTDIVFDIGSNDSTLLKSYKSECIKIGIDPTGEEFKQYYPNNIQLICDYFTEYNYTKHISSKAKIVTSLSMFYDLEDPLQFMKDVTSILNIDGIWVMEQSYMPTMLKKLSFDTICHEHLEYYSFKQIEWMAKIAKLKIISVSLNDCNGGSFRVILTHDNSNLYKYDHNIQTIRNEEFILELNNPNIYINFMNRCDAIKNSLMDFLRYQKSTGKTICIYGASTKGNTLLQYFGIDNKLVDSIAEKNSDKFGKFTPGTHIPIFSESYVRSKSPHFMLVLPWHFKEEFISREYDYLSKGGQLIFPLPVIDIVSIYKKILITGIQGQIGQYLKNNLRIHTNCNIYGLVHKNVNNLDSSVFYIQDDILRKNSIEDIITLIKPKEIYNLVGESDSKTSMNSVSRNIDLNQGIVIRICECIKNTDTRLFNASSSEIYRGIQKKIVSEKELEVYPLNPYAIAKLGSHWIIKYYREQFNLHCSNGIIFTTESPLRKNIFLIKKVVEKLLDIKNGINSELIIGHINTHRDWIHAHDVSTAIINIVSQPFSGDYIISMSKIYSVKELIEIAYEQIGIQIEWNYINNILHGIDSNTKQIYIKCSSTQIKSDVNEMIMGDNTKLKSIGWSPKYCLKSLIKDMIETAQS